MAMGLFSLSLSSAFMVISSIEVTELKT
jgi:hypothetical protein